MAADAKAVSSSELDSDDDLLRVVCNDCGDGVIVLELDGCSEVAKLSVRLD